MALFVAFAFAEESLPEVTREPSLSSPAQQALVQEGVALHDAGDYDGAIRKYKQVLADTPNVVMRSPGNFTFLLRKKGL
jgi:hypothetical protein